MKRALYLCSSCVIIALNNYIIHKLFLLDDYQQYNKNKCNMKIARNGLIKKKKIF